MKIALFLLFLVWLVVFLIVSCAPLWQEAQLGRYVYTQNPNDPAIKPLRVIPIWIDGSFGQADRIEIDNAINAWNYAMNGYVVLQPVDWEFNKEIPKVVASVRDNGWLFMKIDSASKMVPEASAEGYKTTGFTESVSGNHLYIIRDRLQNEDVFGVVLHEIGHLMGSNHVGDRLMSPHYSRVRFQCIDLATVTAVAEAWKIPVSHLNYCVDKEINQVSDLTPDKLKKQQP
jgi:hypothetical protein